jgi:hypothetical protein
MTIEVPTFNRIVKNVHRTYQKNDIAVILDFLLNPSLTRGSLTKVSDDTGIPVQTLFSWREHRTTREGKTWFPQCNGHPNRRIFAPGVEDSIGDFILSNFIESGKGVTRKLVAEIVQNTFRNADDGTTNCARFCASSKYVSNFLSRQQLSLRKPHYCRRLDPEEGEIERFCTAFEEIKQMYPPGRIYNFDETCWQIWIPPERVLAKVGSDAVKVRQRTGLKESLTAFATITLEGDKCPLWIIAKGKTPRCMVSLGQHGSALIRYSPSGWSTNELMREYLKWLHDISNGEPLALIWDVFQSHCSSDVLRCAQELDIEILFIPPGATGLLQPLDVRIFGELKSRARSMFRLQMSSDLRWDLTRDRSLSILVNCWDAISKEFILKAWNVGR